MSQFVDRFGSTAERLEILNGLVAFRQALREAGIIAGFQWLDGSFVEDCEALKGRPPNDVDVVTALRRPADAANDDEWGLFVDANLPGLFDSQNCKAEFKCDAYFVDLDNEPEAVAQQAAYWFGLFSHQRDTFRWKGMVQIPLDSDDEAAAEIIAERLADAD